MNFLWGFVITALYSAPAFAYLDPGTGSMLLQLLIGGVAGAMVVMKLYWHRLKRMFSRSDSEERGEANDQ